MWAERDGERAPLNQEWRIHDAVNAVNQELTMYNLSPSWEYEV